MAAPTPQTSTSIIRLSQSSTKPNGTVKTPAKLSQVKLATDVSPRANITHAPMKLTITAAHERRLLTAFARCVNNVITAALINGANKTIHGRIEFIYFARESRE